MSCATCELHAESTFKIEGMDCREEVAMLERRFKNVAGLEGFAADVIGRRLHVKYDAAKISAAAIADAVADTGMRAWLEHEAPVGGSAERQWVRQGLLWTAAAALALGLIAEWTGGPAALAIACFVASLGAGTALTARKAATAIRARAVDINVLMLIAAAGAVWLGQWSEAATVVFLFSVAQALEARTLDRARFAIRALMDLTPADALVRDGAGDRRMSAEQVVPGMIVVVRPGDKIPLDGQVVAGHSPVNQAPITGESLPIEKAPGDDVFAGTINGRGALEVRVTRVRRDTTLARIIHLVERAQAQRAPAQTIVERFARVYTPAVMTLAACVAVVPPLVFHLSWHAWVYRALVLLVVSCPCALVISTPVSIVAALAGAARKGVLIKGGAHLERTSRVQCIAFDKTGTLTHGAPAVVDVVPLDGASRASILSLAASVEQRSTHPIAHAIVQHAASSLVTAAPADGVLSLPGRGAEGRVRPIGIIALADRPREASRDAVDLLRRHGLKAVVMLTGDNDVTARAIGAQVGVDEVRSELLPEDKVAAIDDLRRRYGSVAMVGDGVNDAPALAAADVGIAMGAAGSDAALETADVALMADELLKIPYAIRLSRATVRNIKVNLAISIVMKAAFVASAIAGIATLWMAIVADTGASVLVIANALRLLRAE